MVVSIFDNEQRVTGIPPSAEFVRLIAYHTSLLMITCSSQGDYVKAIGLHDVMQNRENIILNVCGLRVRRLLGVVGSQQRVIAIGDIGDRILLVQLLGPIDPLQRHAR